MDAIEAIGAAHTEAVSLSLRHARGQTLSDRHLSFRFAFRRVGAGNRGKQAQAPTFRTEMLSRSFLELIENMPTLGVHSQLALYEAPCYSIP